MSQEDMPYHFKNGRPFPFLNGKVWPTANLRPELKPNTFANFEVPAKIAHRNFFFAISGVVNQKKFNN
jgi:hypothetical protein